jgi:hypothetical protein
MGVAFPSVVTFDPSGAIGSPKFCPFASHRHFLAGRVGDDRNVRRGRGDLNIVELVRVQFPIALSSVILPILSLAIFMTPRASVTSASSPESSAVFLPSLALTASQGMAGCHDLPLALPRVLQRCPHDFRVQIVACCEATAHYDRLVHAEQF